MRAAIKNQNPGRQIGNKFGYLGSQFTGSKFEDRKQGLTNGGGSAHKGINNESNTGSQHYEPVGLVNKPKLHRPMVLEKAKKPHKRGKDHFE